MPYQGINYEQKFTFAYYIGVPLIIFCVLGIAIFWPRLVTPAPSNSIAYGCYAANRAPPILLHEGGMKILQVGFPPVSYRLERQKQGIALTAEAPITASQTGRTYTYSISSRGSGRFLSFYKIVNGQRHGVFDDTNLDSFAMLAEDGNYLLYVRGPESVCESS